MPGKGFFYQFRSSRSPLDRLKTIPRKPLIGKKWRLFCRLFVAIINLSNTRHMTFHLESGSHPNKSGNYTIFLSINHQGERKRIKTSISIPIKFWDSTKERVKKTCTTARQDNEELQRLMDKARTIERELNSQDRLTMLRFLDRFQDREQTYMLLSYSQHIRETLELGKQWGTYKKYGDSINKLTDYVQSLGVKDMDFRDITPAFISGFTAYLQTLTNRRNPDTTLSPNSIAKHLKTLRAILNKAADDGLIQPYEIPRKLISVKEIPPTITGLQDEELNKLINLPIKEHTDRWDARNLFLFAMYEGGIRIGDIIQLRWRNIVGDRLIYVMTKNGKQVNVILVQEAKKILMRYKRPGRRPIASVLAQDERNKIPEDPEKRFIKLSP